MCVEVAIFVMMRAWFVIKKGLLFFYKKNRRRRRNWGGGEGVDCLTIT